MSSLVSGPELARLDQVAITKRFGSIANVAENLLAEIDRHLVGEKMASH